MFDTTRTHKTRRVLMLGTWIEVSDPTCRCAMCNRPVLSERWHRLMRRRIREIVKGDRK